jgi:hypothetical protein
MVEMHIGGGTSRVNGIVTLINTDGVPITDSEVGYTPG